MNSTTPIKSGYYQHYKGGYYQVIECARHSETEEWLVIYRPLYGEQSLWARPLTMFIENIGIVGGLIPRFNYLGKTAPKLD